MEGLWSSQSPVLRATVGGQVSGYFQSLSRGYLRQHMGGHRPEPIVIHSTWLTCLAPCGLIPSGLFINPAARGFMTAHQCFTHY